jgi:dethiobiotin synthetase
MKLFITGTDTDVGKTTASAWLCHHTGYAYWKPIQTGTALQECPTDSQTIAQLCPGNLHADFYKMPTNENNTNNPSRCPNSD